MLKPSDKALVPFVSVDNMMALVNYIGLEKFIIELATEIEADFKRWSLFDKTPRVASHSDVGVIELMPTSDGEIYGFKYVNGHPKNTKRRSPNGNCIWFVSRCSNWLSQDSVRNDNVNGSSNCSNLSACSEIFSTS